MNYYVFLTTLTDNNLAGQSLGSSLFNAIFTLLMFVFVVFLAYYSTKLIAKAKNARKGGNLTVLEAASVGMQGTIQLVKVGKQVFLIGVTRDKISFISEIDPESLNQENTAEIIPLRKIPLTFEHYLNKFSKKKEDDSEQK